MAELIQALQAGKWVRYGEVDENGDVHCSDWVYLCEYTGDLIDADGTTFPQYWEVLNDS